MISVGIAIADVLTEAHQAVMDAGALDAAQVQFQYITMHDDKVRPSHAALDGTVWNVDDPLAPVPPLDYGCRCSMMYVGKPKTLAATILPEAPAPVLPKSEVFAKALGKPIPDWKELARVAMHQQADQRFAFLQSSLRARFGAADAQDYARMILEAAVTLKES